MHVVTSTHSIKVSMGQSSAMRRVLEAILRVFELSSPTHTLATRPSFESGSIWRPVYEKERGKGGRGRAREGEGEGREAGGGQEWGGVERMGREGKGRGKEEGGEVV